MDVGRTILAFVIALSVAMLPAAAGMGVALKSAGMSDMSVMGDDCCPPEANPCDMAANGCTTMATCALKCFSFVSNVSSPLVYPRTVANVVPLFESGHFRSQVGSPPFRPPRV
jgi:hypothetical protein